jgi:hypothetical protein
MLRALTIRRLVLALLPTVLLTAGAWASFLREGEGDRSKAKAPPTRPFAVQPTPDPSAEAPLGVDAEPDVTAEPEGKKSKPAKKDADAAADADVAADPAPPAADPLADTGAAVRTAVTDTLASIGYAGAKVEVVDGGRIVNVGVRRSQACDRDAPAGDSLVRRIRAGLPEIQTVRVTVSGSGQSLSEYRRSRCGTAPPRTGGDGDEDDAATGRVVYTKRGSGPFTTPAFTITGRTWTVAYRNESDFFQAFVVKDGKIQPFVLNSDRRGSGSESFRGPGRFKLKINGAEGWSVSVRDGA